MSIAIDKTDRFADVLRGVYELAGINDLRENEAITKPFLRNQLKDIADKLEKIMQDEKLGIDEVETISLEEIRHFKNADHDTEMEGQARYLKQRDLERRLVSR